MGLPTCRPPPCSCFTVSALVVLVALLPWPETLTAANGDVLAVSNALSGVDLSDIAFDSSDDPPGGSFWAVGSRSGRIYHVSRNLRTVFREVPNPHGVGTFPDLVLSFGITYRPSTDTLFVLAQDGAEWIVKEVNKTTGTEIAAGGFTLNGVPANAALRGLAFDRRSDEFWCLDSANDKILRTDLAGAVTREALLPGAEPGPQMDLRGEGVSFEVEGGKKAVYVAYGDIFRVSPARIIALSSAGESRGIEVPLSQVDSSGIKGFATYRIGQQRRIVVIGDDGLLFDVEQRIPTVPPPSEVECSLTLANQVLMRWKNNGSGPANSYGGEIVVERNGIPVATVAGGTTSFTDNTPQEGTSSYSLRASTTTNGTLSPASFPCNVTVGPGGLVRWVGFPGGNAPFDVAADPASGDIFVTDNVGSSGQGAIYRFDDELNLLGEIPSPWEHPGPIAFLPHVKVQVPFGGLLTLDNVLAVGNTDPVTGSQVRIIDLDGTVQIAFPLAVEADEARIGALTFLPGTNQFACLELTQRRIFVLNQNGGFIRSCVPPDFLLPTPLESGLAYDPIQDTFLSIFEDGLVREVFSGESCLPTSFEFSLESLGDGFTSTGFFGGIEIARNTLLVCGRQSRALFQVLIFPSGPTFKRGDFDQNNVVDLTDVVGSSNYLFRSSRTPKCLDAADANDDGVLDVSDPVFLLFYLFLQGPPPPPPFPEPGDDPTFRDNLGCHKV